MEKLEHSLSQIQFGIFFNQAINRPDLVSSAVLQEFPNVFDAPPINLPLPDDAPVDIPISQLRSKNKMWHLNVSKIRADVVFNPNEISNFEDKNNEENIKQIKNIILLCAVQARNQRIKINRIVNFVKYILQIENAIEFLQDKLEIKKIIDTSELKIRFNQIEEKDSFEINNITTIENKIKTKNEEKKENLILLKDVNNVIPNENDFLNENIKDFFSTTGKIVSWKEISKMLE